MQQIATLLFMPRVYPSLSGVHFRILIAMAFTKSKSTSATATEPIIDMINKMPQQDRKAYLDKFENMTPEQRKYPQRG